MRPTKFIAPMLSYGRRADDMARDGGPGQAGAFASPREGAKNALLFAGLNYYYMARAGVEAFVPPMTL